MVYGEDEVITLVLVPLPILFQIITNISDSKQRSVVFHVKVILYSVAVAVTSGGPGWDGRRR